MILSTRTDRGDRDAWEHLAAEALIIDAEEGVRAGDPEAVAWVCSDRFRLCCDVLGLHVDAMRCAVLDEDDTDDEVRALLEDRDAMTTLYALGLTDDALALHLEVAPSTCWRWRRRHGIQVRRQGRPRERTTTRRQAARRAA